jgi:hypothetical protein
MALTLPAAGRIRAVGRCLAALGGWTGTGPRGSLPSFALDMENRPGPGRGEEDGTAGHGQGWLLGADGAAGWVWAICSPVTTVRLRDPVRNNADSVRFR